MAGAFTRYASLVGRSVIVTGGASGIGEAIVRGFAANGAHVTFLDIQRPAGEALADSIAAGGDPKPLFVECDLLDIAAVKAAVARAKSAHGPVTALVNNAANDLRQPFGEVTVEQFDWMIGVNLRHAFFAAQAVVAQMKEAGFGSIINMTSNAWMRGVVDLEAYSAAKAAMLGLANSLARDFGRDRIRVNSIAPGLILTEKQRTMWFSDDAKLAQYLQAQCIPEAIPPEEVAHLALFLAADDSRMITKQCFIINGGNY